MSCHCFGPSFYREYLRRLAIDPVGALHMLRERKHAETDKIDSALARAGFTRIEVEPHGRN